MIPDFDPATGRLPPGIHDATWAEFVARYGLTARRLELLAGLKAGLDALRAAGCQRAYVAGSFVTSKQTPGDFDACWESAGVDIALLHPALLTFTNQRSIQKAVFKGEFFPARAPAVPRRTYFDFFQHSQDGTSKGIVAIDLGGLP